MRLFDCCGKGGDENPFEISFFLVLTVADFKKFGPPFHSLHPPPLCTIAALLIFVILCQ
jgi:hypothetical protein